MMKRSKNQSKENNVLRVPLTETEFHTKENNEKHVAEKEKIKEKI